jgi:hypothetical protein
MHKQVKTAAELEGLILSGLQVQNIDAASIEVYGLDEPNIEMTWTVRRLRLNKPSEVKVEGAVKRVVFALVEQYDLAAETSTGVEHLPDTGSTQRGA